MSDKDASLVFFDECIERVGNLTATAHVVDINPYEMLKSLDLFSQLQISLIDLQVLLYALVLLCAVCFIVTYHTIVEIEMI